MIAVSIFFIALTVILGVIAVFVYMLVYNHRIKKQLSGEKQYKHRNINPQSIIIIVLCAMLVVISVSSIINIRTYNTSCNDELYKCSSVFYTAEEFEDSSLSIYKSAYEKGKISGYDKSEENDGDFHYTLFKKDETYDTLQPDFLIFIEYRGKEKFTESLVKDSMDSYQVATESMIAYDEPTEYYFACGNIEDTIDYTFSLGLYKDKNVRDKDFDNVNLVNADKLLEISM